MAPVFPPCSNEHKSQCLLSSIQSCSLFVINPILITNNLVWCSNSIGLLTIINLCNAFHKLKLNQHETTSQIQIKYNLSYLPSFLITCCIARQMQFKVTHHTVTNINKKVIVLLFSPNQMFVFRFVTGPRSSDIG